MQIRIILSDKSWVTLFNNINGFEELTVTRFFTTLVIATLLFSVTISNFNFNVYAEEENTESQN